MYYKCSECGHVFLWKPLQHWGPICPKCDGHHSVLLPGE